jgi:hypothetical protein
MKKWCFLRGRFYSVGGCPVNPSSSKLADPPMRVERVHLPSQLGTTKVIKLRKYLGKSPVVLFLCIEAFAFLP